GLGEPIPDLVGAMSILTDIEETSVRVDQQTYQYFGNPIFGGLDITIPHVSTYSNTRYHPEHHFDRPPTMRYDTAFINGVNYVRQERNLAKAAFLRRNLLAACLEVSRA